MKSTVALAALLVASLAYAISVNGQEKTGSRLRAHFTDGSQVYGTTSSDSIKLKLDFSELSIPLEKVRRIVWTPKTLAARVELENDDVLTGSIANETIPLSAIFGKLDLRLEHLKSLERLPPQSAGSMPIRKGLVAYYSFDHREDSLGVDDAAEKFRAEVKGVKWIESGKLGGAAEFDGASALSVPHDDALNFTKGLTLSAWIHPAQADRYGYAMVVGKTSGSSWQKGFGLARMSGDAENLYFFVNNYSRNAVKAPVKADRWSHVAGVFDGKAIKIYVDGKQVESLSLAESAKELGSSSPDLVEIQPINVPLMFGCDQSGYFWKGKLDEAALYDRPLSDEEILRLYEVGGSEIAAKK